MKTKLAIIVAALFAAMWSIAPASAMPMSSGALDAVKEAAKGATNVEKVHKRRYRKYRRYRRFHRPRRFHSRRYYSRRYYRPRYYAYYGHPYRYYYPRRRGGISIHIGF